VIMLMSLLAISLIIASSYIAPSSSVPMRKDRYDIILSNVGRVPEPSDSRILESGSNFIIICQLDDSVIGARNIVWMHNDAESSNYNNIKVKQSPRRLRITINSFNSANVGFYSCKTSDEKARGTRRVRLLERCPDAFTGYCHNGGECVWDGTGAASCFCAKGFLGKRCEKIIPPMPVITDKGNLTSLTILLTLLSVVLLIGVLLGIAAIRYRLQRTHDMKSRSTYATNTVKVAAICPEYSNEIQKEPLIVGESMESAENIATKEPKEEHIMEPLVVFNPNEESEQKRFKQQLQRSNAIEEM
uniref:Ig-like domain-containing protein n=1 Tax=Parascaris univalens TaxID=6257 RepID=A0A915BDP0_PARUN